MTDFVNIAIHEYCESLAKKYGIKDLQRVEEIIKRTLVTFDYKKLGKRMGLWDGSKTSIILESSLYILKYFPPITVDLLKSQKAEELKEFLSDEGICKLLIQLFKFQPSLKEALNYLQYENALNLFENEDLQSLAQKEGFVKALNGDEFFFYTLDELANVLEDFINEQEEYSDFILQTGFNKRTFKKHILLDELSRCYYTRCPEKISFYDPLSKDSRPLAFIGYKKSMFWDLIYEFSSFIKPKKDFLLEFTWQGGSYEKAPYIESLDERSAKLIEEARFLFFDYKLKNLKAILKYLRNHTSTNLWKECFSLFKDVFSEIEMFMGAMKFDYSFYYQVDEDEKELEAFISYKDRGFPYRRIAKPYLNGGLKGIVDAIRFFEKEIEIGTYSKTKEILNEILGDISLKSYYQAVNYPWKDTIELALNKFLQLEEHEIRFNKEFNERMDHDLDDLYYLKIPVKVKYSDQVEKFSKLLESIGATDVSFHVTITPVVKMFQKMKEHQPIPFPTPPGTKWEEVKIRFISDEDVLVNVKDIQETRNFRQMGFEDRRTEKPNMAWHTLKDFGKFQEEISWQDKGVNFKVNKHIVSYLKDIRRRMRKLFGIEGNPFHPYNRKSRSYKAKFNISVSETLED